MSSLRSRTIRLAFAQPELRPVLLPILQPAPDRFVTVGNPAWREAAEDARRAALAVRHPCRCMGPTATIQDRGRGPVLDVAYGHDIGQEDLELLDGAVSALGWRGWSYGTRGIVFKPTTVRIARSLRISAET